MCILRNNVMSYICGHEDHWPTQDPECYRGILSGWCRKRQDPASIPLTSHLNDLPCELCKDSQSWILVRCPRTGKEIWEKNANMPAPKESSALVRYAETAFSFICSIHRPLISFEMFQEMIIIDMSKNRHIPYEKV